MIMLAFAVSIVAAVLFLPNSGATWVLWASLLTLAAVGLLRRHFKQHKMALKYIALGAVVVAGCQWGMLGAARFEALVLDPDREYVLVGTVTDIPKQRFKQNQAQIRIECLGTQRGRCDIYRASERLPVYFWPVYSDVSGAQSRWPIHPGQRWLMPVKFKPVKAKLGPFDFDVANWLKSRHVIARFKLAAGAEPTLLDDSRFSVDRIRAGLNRYFAEMDSRYQGPGLSPYPVLLALISGDRSLMTQHHWQLFNRTGTTHLVAISGLHIGLVALFVIKLCTPLLARWRWFTHRFPANNGAALLALFVAAGYCALAGFALPTQRALIMLAVFVLLKWVGRSRQLWFALATAFFLVLTWDPVACLSIGFWLSFIAVYAILWMVGGQVVTAPSWHRWWVIQLGLFFALAPVLLWKMQSVSVVSPVTNVFAIPLVGFLLAPLVLIWVCLWGVLGSGADGLLWVSSWLGNALIMLLQWFSDWQYSLYQVGARPFWAMPLAYVGMIWLCTAGLPGRLFSLLLMLPLLLPVSGHQGLYIGGKQPQILWHSGDRIVAISQSNWPKLIPRWQSQWFDYWGVSHAGAFLLQNAAASWDSKGWVLAEYNIESGWLGQRFVRRAHYVDLCAQPSQQFEFNSSEAFSIQTLRDNRYPQHCALILTWNDRRWLIWPSQSTRSQRYILENELTQLADNSSIQMDYIVMFPAPKHKLNQHILNWLGHQGEVLALKPVSDEFTGLLQHKNGVLDRVQNGEFRRFGRGDQ